MNVDEVFIKIPIFISSFYDNIYAFVQDKNQFFNIEYNGVELKVNKEESYQELEEKLSVFKEDVLSLVLDKKVSKQIVHTKDNKEKVLTIDIEDNITFIFIMDISKTVSGDKKYLVIADDSPIITKFFNKIFCNEFEVLIANDGNELISILNDNKDKDIVGVFLDLSMPNKNGFEVLEYFKENNLFSVYPVSIISGEDTADGIAKALEFPGVIDMLKKPFSIDAAKAIVNKTIGFSPKMK